MIEAGYSTCETRVSRRPTLRALWRFLLAQAVNYVRSYFANIKTFRSLHSLRARAEFIFRLWVGTCAKRRSVVGGD